MGGKVNSEDKRTEPERFPALKEVSDDRPYLAR
jgi:hypothetical protein